MRKIPTPIFVGLVLVAVLATLHLSGMFIPSSQVEQDIANDVRTVNTSFYTVDMEQAMKMVTFDPPKMLNPPDVIPPLLKFPPSPQTLAQMTGQ